jgi:membrane-associated protein
MDYILGTLLSYLLLYKYLALFLVIFTAGLIMPWPANTLLFAVGAFAGQGYFDIWLSFVVAEASNILGDYCGFLLTYLLKYRVVKRGYLEKLPFFASAERYVRKHAALTIIATRFMGTPGSLVNFLAGLSGIPAGRFLAYDAIGNALDIGFFLALGYVLGTFTENISDLLSILGWMMIVGFLLLVLLKLIRRRS